jgi:RHS repeat-associated protein
MVHTNIVKAGPPANVYKIVNNRDSTHARDQSFTYDSLNRILSGQSSGTGGTSWGNTYVIDAWGNLTNMNPISGKGYGQNFQAAPASVKNQLNGYCNDAAGNLILNITCPQNPTPAYVYDAENRLVWTSGYRYIYDGNGERVEKCTAATATTACPTSGTTGTLYWRGTGSDTLAETDLGGNDQEEYIFFNGQRIARRDTTSTGTTIAIHYYFSDHLGTHGVVENATGTVCEQDIDYYPYGGVQNDYCNSTSVPQNYKFTGKERDSESGLDYFGARHHASSLGRLMTPDWAARPVTVPYANFGNPQSLNLYSYVENNPTTFGDPDGHCCDWLVNVFAGAAKGLSNMAMPGTNVSNAMHNAFFPNKPALPTNLPSHTYSNATQQISGVVVQGTVTLAAAAIGVPSTTGATTAAAAGGTADTGSVLAGHGSWDGTMMTLPEGTSLTIPTGLGGSISDAYGNAIETGASLEPYTNEMIGAQSYLPGSPAPDLTLSPPTADLNIAPTSTTVSTPTSLSDIAQPNQGNIKWAACCANED